MMKDNPKQQLKRHNILFFDIETNAIDHWPTLGGLKDLHCISIMDHRSGVMKSFNSQEDNIQEGIDMLNNAAYICGHNAIGFDAPALRKLGYTLDAKVLDTKVMSSCIYPDLMSDDCKLPETRLPVQFRGRHSLKAWGYRLGVHKGEHGDTEDWTMWSQEMQDYCEQDVKVTASLFDYLLNQKPSSDMLHLEHDFAEIISKQEDNGWPFDIIKAELLTEKLMAERADLQAKLQDTFTPQVIETKTPKGWRVEVDGKTFEAATKTALKAQLKEVKLKQKFADSAVKMDNKTKSIPFNPNSRDQIAERLMEAGWKPEKYDGKRPKIDEAVLRGIGTPEADMLLQYLLLTKRLGQIAEGNNAWLKLLKGERIHGQINTNGAISGRCTHNRPNIAQVPASRAPYGKECRELFTAPEGKVLVGVDASGLELRCLAHYLAQWDKGHYANEILSGDIHSANQMAAGLPTRDHAKTFIYAFLYGAGDAKIGSIVGGSRKEGRRLKQSFMNKIPAIKKLSTAIESSLEKRPYLTGLDGRKLPCRSPHSALNLLLQSAGAVIMKKALVLFAERAEAPYEMHGNIHDEVQLSCLPEHGDLLGETFVECIALAGKKLKFRCKLDGEYHLGDTWAETH